MEKRKRIKKYELDFLRHGKKVQVNSHDLVAWPLFSKLKKAVNTGSDTLDVVEELRKIAVQVGAYEYIYPAYYHGMHVSIHIIMACTLAYYHGMHVSMHIIMSCMLAYYHGMHVSILSWHAC